MKLRKIKYKITASMATPATHKNKETQKKTGNH